MAHRWSWVPILWQNGICDYEAVLLINSRFVYSVQCNGTERGVFAVPVAPRLMSRLVTEEFIIGERCRRIKTWQTVSSQAQRPEHNNWETRVFLSQFYIAMLILILSSRCYNIYLIKGHNNILLHFAQQVFCLFTNFRNIFLLLTIFIKIDILG